VKDVSGVLAGARPVLGWNGSRLVSRQPPPGRRLALTFDDGPDPRWTPRIAAALRRLHVPATFFVIGSKVVRYPDLVRSLHRWGFELGNHTFTHVDLASLPVWERRLQISLTERALDAVVGVGSRLVRPPYSSVPAAVTRAQERAYADLASHGYLIVLSDLDGEDWQRPGVGAIVRAVTPRHDGGGIVLLHDGGGDRSQTLAAVERLVPRLRARGFRFVTVSQLAGLTPAQVALQAPRWDRARGRLLVGTLAAARSTSLSPSCSCSPPRSSPCGWWCCFSPGGTRGSCAGAHPAPPSDRPSRSSCLHSTRPQGSNGRCVPSLPAPTPSSS
jgi:peptidoglycan/xylan/chitin deacetylase (PgdA/CDA1 family)